MKNLINIAIYAIVVCIIPTHTIHSQTLQIDQVGGELSNEEIREIRKLLGSELGYYQNIFDVENVEIKIKLFENFDEYQAYQKEISTSNSANGFYSISTKTAVVYKDEYFIDIINHEVSHLILWSNVYNPPNWIDEGMAELFEYDHIFEGEVFFGTQSTKINKVKKWINEGKVDLEEFLTYSNPKWREINEEIDNYSYSLSYCMMLYLQNEHPGKIERIIKQIEQGSNSIDTVEAIYPGGVSAFDDDFKNYFTNELTINY